MFQLILLGLPGIQAIFYLIQNYFTTSSPGLKYLSCFLLPAYKVQDFRKMLKNDSVCGCTCPASTV
jgi:hypothetical protein